MAALLSSHTFKTQFLTFVLKIVVLLFLLVFTFSLFTVALCFTKYRIHRQQGIAFYLSKNDCCLYCVFWWRGWGFLDTSIIHKCMIQFHNLAVWLSVLATKELNFWSFRSFFSSLPKDYIYRISIVQVGFEYPITCDITKSLLITWMLVCWFVGCLIGWLLGWLFGWLVGLIGYGTIGHMNHTFYTLNVFIIIQIQYFLDLIG